MRKQLTAQDIRVGNYLLVGGEIREVYSVSKYRITFLVPSAAKVKSIRWFAFDDIKPIPITEEWLINFGFKSDGYKKEFIGKDFRSNGMTLDFVLSKPLTKGEWNEFYTYNLESYRYKNIENIHQLQNLYWDLTNEELKLKDK